MSVVTRPANEPIDGVQTLDPLKIVFEQMRAIARDAIELAPQVLAAVLALVVTFAVSKILQGLLARALRSSRLRPSLRTLFINVFIAFLPSLSSLFLILRLDSAIF